MVWQLLPAISAPMPFQMAFDNLLFEKQKQIRQNPILRFYLSSDPWISVGYSFQESKVSGGSLAEKSELIRRNPQVPVCRRITGGGCVLHGKDLIFSLIARYEERDSPSHAFKGTVPLSSKGTGTPAASLCEAKRQGSQSPPFDPLSSVRTSYGKIHEAVKIALQGLGIVSRFFNAEEPFPQGNDCFCSPVASDLAVSNEKVAGGAQKRSQGVLLHQESIRIPVGIEWNRLVSEIRKGFETVFSVSIQPCEGDPAIFFEAERNSQTD